MGLALTSTFALCLWVALWAVGIKGIDGMLLAITIILIAATLRTLTKYLPGAERS